MTTIALPPDLEAPLSEQAQRRGTTVERLALDTLRERFVPVVNTPSPVEPAETLADFLAGHIGVIDGSTEALSKNCGERFTQGLIEKQQRGHL